LAFLDRLDDGAPLELEAYAAVEHRRQLVQLLPPAHGVPKLIYLVSENAGVVHESVAAIL
jgi:hypothetical protein